MFPVISASGRVLAFGGRIIGKGEGAKYMNTGDTLIYNKRHNIYAINLMKGRKLDELIMVEGYMDVISLHQAGIDNRCFPRHRAYKPAGAPHGTVCKAGLLCL